MSVHSLLVSGTDEELWDWHIAVCMCLNCIERRDQTVNYTCLEEHYEAALEIARSVGVTVQEWSSGVGDPDGKWAVVVEGKSGIKYEMPTDVSK